MITISKINIIGNEIAIRWSDDSEDYYAMDHLRSVSPSAETQGEHDLLGNPISGNQRGHDFTGVTVTDWKFVGSYGIRIHFSDGHQTGIYGFEYLKEIAKKAS